MEFKAQTEQDHSQSEETETPVITNDSATYERPTLAILPQRSDVYTDAQPAPDLQAVERFCQVWAEVGRAILLRRSQRK